VAAREVLHKSLPRPRFNFGKVRHVSIFCWGGGRRGEAGIVEVQLHNVISQNESQETSILLNVYVHNV
jgi:hypothetical protein